jgi:hypothetical protein
MWPWPNRKTNGAEAISEAALNSAFSVLVDGLMETPEIREAALSRADIELALEDANWIRLGKSAEMDAVSRRAVVERARLYWHRDPLAKQAVRLWTDYSVGTGMSFRAKDQKAQLLLEAFWKHRKNRKLLGPGGQRKSSQKLLIDGEVFFAVFEGEPPLLRRIDPLQISKIITHPEDEETPVYYQRDFATDAGGQVTRFYRDWALEAEEEKEVEGKGKDANGQAVNSEKVEEKVVIYHAALDPFRNRGNSLLMPVLDWLRENRRFMQARVAITQSLARFVMKAKVKGGPAVLEAARKTLASALTQGGDTETNPPAAAGSTWFENQGMDLSAITRKSGAGEARDDSDMFKLMVSPGVGIFLHYFGDPSTGNLATATAMELPMLKQFGAYQQFWTGVYEDLDTIVLDQAKFTGDRFVDRDWPPIIEADIGVLATAFAAFAQAMPGLMEQPELVQRVLTALLINNPQEIIKRMQGAQPAPPESAESAARLAVALREFRESLTHGLHSST